ncbi:hypothetical protein PAP_10025 [Palaeococcus pacificus DY20341]|uniref:Transcription regulator PadR N-terminal domain-containing protein n=1 Tax=Palaeococcus pacificus DY20341 TaxID=1343739 RepID=A0A075LVL2_9EURY|nr:PadR family transcriptional regulator [Palaeococcus pacificus]AIF70379.1 hypothetical protein PAP_10025 [Palaeococcus pacificus DY20341]
MFGNGKRRAIKKLKKELRAGTYSFIILSLLKDKPMHGYGIRKAFSELSEGRIVPSEGTLYDLLKSLEKYKLVESFWAEVGGRARKYYKITSLGEEVLSELKEEVSFIGEILERLGEGYE